jgi:dihydroorotate dehydrogenase
MHSSSDGDDVAQNSEVSLSERTLGFASSLLRCLPPELSHDLAILFLSQALTKHFKTPEFETHTSFASSIEGIGKLAHPIGLAAGFDKQAQVIAGLSQLGFSALELGTVTPLAQPGNPKPRVFRIKDAHALVNRFGFNSCGMGAFADNLKKFDRRLAPQMKIGVNVGKNKQTTDEAAAKDFLVQLRQFAPLADYLVVNLSSPNTPGLRGLAQPAFVSELRQNLDSNIAAKTWIKLDPDSAKKDFQAVVESVEKQGFAGVVLTNTHRVEWPEAGGLSGAPLAVASTQRLEWAYEVLQGRLPMIASGGVMSGIDVFQKLARGASLVQVYTAMIYRGPWIVLKLLRELDAEMRLRGMKTVQDVIGSHYLGG